jgi:hypothetical protein
VAESVKKRAKGVVEGLREGLRGSLGRDDAKQGPRGEGDA